jgi:hypothetical protein
MQSERLIISMAGGEKKYWWRESRRLNSKSPWPESKLISNFFKIKTKGKCFNCLALDHIKLNCRDPPKCWSCGRSGHISSFCRFKKKVVCSKPTPAAISSPPCNLSSSLDFPLLPPRHHLSNSSQMERRLSFGSASNGLCHCYDDVVVLGHQREE